MKIAVTYENGEVFRHFGRTEQFKISDVEENRIKNAEIVSTGGQGHGALAGFLKERGVAALICGGIGGGAETLLRNEGIAVCAGVHGNTDAAVEKYLAGTLSDDPEARCRHHEGGCHH